jgi:hypothetical protein
VAGSRLGNAHPPVLRDTYVLGVARWPNTLGNALELANPANPSKGRSAENTADLFCG